MRLTERSTDIATRFLSRREAVQRAARLRAWSAALNDIRKEHRRLLVEAEERLRMQRLTSSGNTATNAR